MKQNKNHDYFSHELYLNFFTDCLEIKIHKFMEKKRWLGLLYKNQAQSNRWFVCCFLCWPSCMGSCQSLLLLSLNYMKSVNGDRSSKQWIMHLQLAGQSRVKSIKTKSGT